MTMKRGPLNKAEKYYILHNPESKSAEELSSELNRNVGQIKKEMAKAEVQKVKESVTTTRQSQTDQLMGKHKRNDKIVATVMTQAASELSDATRSKIVNLPNKLRDSIHKPKS